MGLDDARRFSFGRRWQLHARRYVVSQGVETKGGGGAGVVQVGADGREVRMRNSGMETAATTAKLRQNINAGRSVRLQRQ
jgi:hypothetical protein